MKLLFCSVHVQATLLRSALCLSILIVLCQGLSADQLVADNVEKSTRTSPARPNVVLILADDLGARDLACYDADLHETPHLDRFASENLRFLNAYAMSVCSPSRAALMTGRHAARLRMTIWSEGSLSGPKDRPLLQAESRHDLPLEELTLAEQFYAAGYLTALVGKWHLGGPGHFPEAQGFDVNIGGNHWGAPQTFWWPWKGNKRYGGEFRYIPHLEFGKPGDYLTDRLTDEAIRVIDRSQGQPFFLCLTHYAPHTPLEAKSDDVQYFQQKIRPEFNHQNPVYAAMVKSLDESVGRVLQHLDALKLSDNTIVIFTSDNGGSLGIDRLSGMTVPSSSNAPLRSGKGSLYEGGIRVPLIIRWPGVTGHGAHCAEPVVIMDLFHTLVRVADPQVAADRHSSGASGAATGADGLDLMPLMRNPQDTLDREALYFHYPHYYDTTTPVSAVRAGQWKLLEYLEDKSLELYDLESDPSESRNLAMQHSETTARLRQQLEDWRKSVSAAMPVPNPQWKAVKAD